MSRKIGSLTVSAVGLGCMNISAGYGAADDSESEALLHEALDIGINFLDTAHIYGAGHSETLIGKSLSNRRDDYVLASKCGLSAQGIDGRPETIRQQCETSLQRLRTDVIDLYYLHRVDPAVPIEDSVGAISELVREGKVREIGLSEVSSDSLFRAQAVHRIAAVQSEYSLWSRTPEYGMLQACLRTGVAFVPFSPLGRGFLAGTASDVTQLSDDDLRATIARPRFEPEAFAANEQLLVRFRQIATDYDCTTAQLALAWLLNIQNRNLVPIPGTRNNLHLQENAEAMHIRLDESTIQTLDLLINESVVTGTRYTAERMLETDSEEDVTSNQK